MMACNPLNNFTYYKKSTSCCGGDQNAALRAIKATEHFGDAHTRRGTDSKQPGKRTVAATG